MFLGQNAPAIGLQGTTGDDPEENTKQASAYYNGGYRDHGFILRPARCHKSLEMRLH